MSKPRDVVEQAVLDMGGTVINLDKISKDRILMSVEHGNNNNHTIMENEETKVPVEPTDPVEPNAPTDPVEPDAI